MRLTGNDDVIPDPDQEPNASLCHAQNSILQQNIDLLVSLKTMQQLFPWTSITVGFNRRLRRIPEYNRALALHQPRRGDISVAKSKYIKFISFGEAKYQAPTGANVCSFFLYQPRVDTRGYKYFAPAGDFYISPFLACYAAGVKEDESD